MILHIHMWGTNIWSNTDNFAFVIGLTMQSYLLHSSVCHETYPHCFSLFYMESFGTYTISIRKTFIM